MTTFRRTLATLAASALAVTALAPAASAQISLIDLLGGADKAIADVHCDALGAALTGAGLVGDDTTHSGLVANINNATSPVTGNDLYAKLITAQYSNQIADKALDCGIVKADPQELFPGSSQITETLRMFSSV